MNFNLTESQKEWLKKHKLKVGNLYSIPDCGFYVYEAPKYGTGEYISLPPNKTTSNIFFRLLHIDDDFLHGHFYIPETGKTIAKFIYMQREDIEMRAPIEYYMLSLFCVLPMMIYNFFKNK